MSDINDQDKLHVFTHENIGSFARGPDGDLWHSIGWYSQPTVMLENVKTGEKAVMDPRCMNAKGYTHVENPEVELVSIIRELKSPSAVRGMSSKTAAEYAQDLKDVLLNLQTRFFTPNGDVYQKILAVAMYLQNQSADNGNEEAVGLMRQAHKDVFGGNHTFIDDDITALKAQALHGLNQPA